MSIKEMVAEGRMVTFVHYRLGELWYRTETGFNFPVPTSDCGDGMFLAKDKAILFMRYMRKHLTYLGEAKRSHDATLTANGTLADSPGRSPMGRPGVPVPGAPRD